MKAEIIPTGTEILLGNIMDTNSPFLANQLPLLGIDLYFISTVGDNKERLVDTLKRAWMRADLIITVGGLGPTEGDITREAIAELVGEELKVDEGLWQELQSRYLKAIAGLIGEETKLDEKSRQELQSKYQSYIKRQATVIPSAQLIPSSIGTAPGWWIEEDDKLIIALPGPPDEMELMWEEGVLPKLRQKVGGVVILSKTIKTFGLSEVEIAKMLASLIRLPNPTLATYVKPDGIWLRVTAKAEGETEAKRMIADEEATIRETLASYIWGLNDDTLESVIGNLLKAKNLSLATMESFTDGLLSNTLASSPESSSYFRGGLLACCDEAKITFGVDPHIIKRYGNENSQVAEAMAEVARRNFKADVGLGIAGSMDPYEKTGNIFIGLNRDEFKRIIPNTTFGNLLRVKQRAVHAALFELRRMLLEEV